MYTVAETIHHGGYIAVAQVAGDGSTSTPRADFEDLIENSPYYQNVPRDVRDQIWLDLTRYGTAEHGWATYTLTETA